MENYFTELLKDIIRYSSIEDFMNFIEEKRLHTQIDGEVKTFDYLFIVEESKKELNYSGDELEEFLNYALKK
jgi:hypothetical protein